MFLLHGSNSFSIKWLGHKNGVDSDLKSQGKINMMIAAKYTSSSVLKGEDNLGNQCFHSVLGLLPSP